MSLEKPEPPEQHRSEAFKAGAFGLALLEGLAHTGPTQALEVPPETPWTVGVTENIRNAAVTEKNESVTAFILFADGTSAWATVTEGTTERIKYTRDKEVNFLVSQYQPKPIEIRCQIHTHPEITDIQGKTYHVLHQPPSLIDLEHKETERQDSLTFSNFMNMPIQKHAYGVADSKGIWYYGAADTKNADPAKIQASEEAIKAFLVKNWDGKFDFDTSYKELRAAYKKHLNADIRFVPYEKIADEPVCAGVDYEEGQVAQKQEKKPSEMKKWDDGWGPSAAAFGIGQN